MAILFVSTSINYWTMMRFSGRGGHAAPHAWKDQVFSRALPSYLFDLPFYSEVLGFVFVLAILCALVFFGRVNPRLWSDDGFSESLRRHGKLPDPPTLRPNGLLPDSRQTGNGGGVGNTWAFVGTNPEIFLPDCRTGSNPHAEAL